MIEDREAIEASVAERFAAIALNPADERKFPYGRESALRLGYAAEDLDSLPAAAVEAFAGVGNPFSLGRPKAGQTVLDLGCGAGTDSILAARWVQAASSPPHPLTPSLPRAAGHVIGVDMVPEMVARARRSAEPAGIHNVEFVIGKADCLPVPESWADLVITNGVLNLCVDKPRVVAEIRRALRPGGRLQMADILLEPHVTPEEVAGKGAWSD